MSRGPRRALIAAGLVRACYDLRRLKAVLRFGAEALEGTSRLSPSEAIEVRLAVADARHLLGMDDAEKSLAELAKLQERARTGADDVRLARVLDGRVQLLDREGLRDAVVEELGRIRGMELPANRGARCRILATLATQVEYGDADAGLDSARRAVRLARTADLHDEGVLSRRARVVSHSVAGIDLTTPVARTPAN